MTARGLICRGLVVVSVCASMAAQAGVVPAQSPAFLPASQRVAPGVDFFELTNSEALGIPGTIAVQLLRIDPAHAELRLARAQDHRTAKETVPAIARRVGALAAVNSGFFIVATGEPAGILAVSGDLVRDTRLPRGAIALRCEGNGRAALSFDRTTARVHVRFPSGPSPRELALAGINTTRLKNGLMLYTPRYGEQTGTAASGIEWILEDVSRTERPPPAAVPGSRDRVLRVVDRRDAAGDSPIPPGGVVLSYGGTTPDPPLAGLVKGGQVTLVTRFETLLGGRSADWQLARDIVGGAGLLVRRGVPIRDWTAERLRAGFTTERHPRTLVGVDRAGMIWLATVDGRNPEVSIGMTFDDLQTLSKRLSLTDSLNLDGGGSTTMVVEGRVRNHPSDPTGPRLVSDALVVFARKCSG